MTRRPSGRSRASRAPSRASPAALSWIDTGGGTKTMSEHEAAEPFVHPALFYAGPDEYLAGTVPFIEAGLAAGEPVMVAVPGDNLERIRAALGPAANRVVLHNMQLAGRNPGRIIPGVLLAFAAAHAGRPVRIIGEPIWAGRSRAGGPPAGSAPAGRPASGGAPAAGRVGIAGEPIWAGRSPLESPACAQHEALINTAFAGRDATILCPYDTTRLDPDWVRDAYRTHPVVWTTSVRHDSAHYRDPVDVAAGFNLPLPDPPPHATTMAVEMTGLAAVRRLAAAGGRAAGLPGGRGTDPIVAGREP